jgi:hypothetical protein
MEPEKLNISYACDYNTLRSESLANYAVLPITLPFKLRHMHVLVRDLMTYVV